MSHCQQHNVNVRGVSDVIADASQDGCSPLRSLSDKQPPACAATVTSTDELARLLSSPFLTSTSPLCSPLPSPSPFLTLSFSVSPPSSLRFVFLLLICFCQNKTITSVAVYKHSPVI